MESTMSHGGQIASLSIVVTLCALLSAPLICDARSASKPDRIRIAYVLPVDAAHQPLYTLLQQRRILERFRDFLSFLRLPKPLLLKVAGCDGEANAWYDPEKREVTVCYEYVAHIQRISPTETTVGVTPENAVVGPFIEVFWHEVSHALFDLLRVPILGREEDAADQVATYIMLQLGKDVARTTIVGVAWMYAQDAKRSDIGLSHYADVHSLDAQRFYNVLCLAYGADPKLFADMIEKKYLPQDRGEGCADEYRQVAYAVRRLMSPHVDKARAKKVRAKNPLRSDGVLPPRRRKKAHNHDQANRCREPEWPREAKLAAGPVRLFVNLGGAAVSAPPASLFVRGCAGTVATADSRHRADGLAAVARAVAVGRPGAGWQRHNPVPVGRGDACPFSAGSAAPDPRRAGGPHADASGGEAVPGP